MKGTGIKTTPPCSQVQSLDGALPRSWTSVKRLRAMRLESLQQQILGSVGLQWLWGTASKIHWQVTRTGEEDVCAVFQTHAVSGKSTVWFGSHPSSARNGLETKSARCRGSRAARNWTPWHAVVFGNSSWRAQTPVDRCLFENEPSLRLISVFGRRVLLSRVYPSSGSSSSYYYFCPLSTCQYSLYVCLWGRGCFLELIVLLLQLQLLSKNIIWKYL